MVEDVRELRQGEAIAAQDVKDDTRVDRTSSGAHHQSFERRHSHRRVHRATRRDRRHGATIAEMGDNDSQGVHRASEEPAGLFDRPGHRQAV